MTHVSTVSRLRNPDTTEMFVKSTRLKLRPLLCIYLWTPMTFWYQHFKFFQPYLLNVYHILWWLRLVKNPPAVQETWVWSLSWEDPLEKGRATHSVILAWRKTWTEEPGRLMSMGLQRVGHDWVTNTFHHISGTILRFGNTAMNKTKLVSVEPTVSREHFSLEGTPLPVALEPPQISSSQISLTLFSSTQARQGLAPVSTQILSAEIYFWSLLEKF